MTKKEKNAILVPICEKAFITIDEACAYTNIGRHKIRALIDNAGPELSILVGRKMLINRERLIEFLNNKCAV